MIHPHHCEMWTRYAYVSASPSAAGRDMVLRGQMEIPAFAFSGSIVRRGGEYQCYFLSWLIQLQSVCNVCLCTFENCIFLTVVVKQWNLSPNVASDFISEEVTLTLLACKISIGKTGECCRLE